MHKARKPQSEIIATAAKPASTKASKPRTTRKAEPTSAARFDPDAHRQEIAETAYYLWLARDNQQGSAEEDWARAEVIVQLRYGAGRRAAAARSR